MFRSTAKTGFYTQYSVIHVRAQIALEDRIRIVRIEEENDRLVVHTEVCAGITTIGFVGLKLFWLVIPIGTKPVVAASPTFSPTQPYVVGGPGRCV